MAAAHPHRASVQGAVWSSALSNAPRASLRVTAGVLVIQVRPR